jgi:hypothetical protein
MHRGGKRSLAFPGPVPQAGFSDFSRTNSWCPFGAESRPSCFSQLLDHRNPDFPGIEFCKCLFLTLNSYNKYLKFNELFLNIPFVLYNNRPSRGRLPFDHLNR